MKRTSRLGQLRTNDVLPTKGSYESLRETLTVEADVIDALRSADAFGAHVIATGLLNLDQEEGPPDFAKVVVYERRKLQAEGNAFQRAVGESHRIDAA